jgi:hypothetical protein
MYAAPGLATLTVGAKAALVLRPEALEPCASRDAGAFSAQVTGVVFQGRGFLITAEAAGLTLRYAAEIAAGPGGAVWLRILPEKTFVTAVVD